MWINKVIIGNAQSLLLFHWQRILNIYIEFIGLLVHFDGYLNKQSQKNSKKFHRRWFKVWEDDLFYFNEQQPKDTSLQNHPPNAIIHLRDVESIGKLFSYVTIKCLFLFLF